MIHIFQKGTNSKTLVLFHGTGGNEFDLIPLAIQIDPQANILSFRGRIMENGMPRFFRRLAPGVFDIPNLIEETQHALKTLDELVAKYQLNQEALILVGYSNGANMIASMLLHQKMSQAKAILLRAMTPLKEVKVNDLSQTKILLLSGKYDHIMPTDSVQELAQMFTQRKAHMQLVWLEQGHELSTTDIQHARQWVQSLS